MDTASSPKMRPDMRPNGQDVDMSDAEKSPGPAQAVLIAGPTASGKSALALRLAERIGGAVINADSMQVYGDLAIITARPGAAEQAGVPHLLYGHVDAAVNYSVGQYVADAGKALAEVARIGKVPIFVGGTGLYFKALTAGLAAVPPIPADIRAGVRERLARHGAAARSAAAGHEGAWRPVADPPSGGRDVARRGGRQGPAGHPALCQAPVHLVSPPARGLARPGPGGGLRPSGARFGALN